MKILIALLFNSYFEPLYNVAKWPNIRQKSCCFYTVRLLKYVWPFCNIMHERVCLLNHAFNLLTRAFKAIVNLFSYEKKVTLFLYKSTHRTILCKKNYFFSSIHFSFSSTTSVVLLHVRGPRCF